MEFLAAGSEGEVYRIDDVTVRKVWHRRGVASLERSRLFYADVAAAGLPFATPEILDVGQIDGATVTVERYLRGTPLTPFGDGPEGPAAVEVVLRALRTVAPTPAIQTAPVLDDDSPLWTSGPFGPAVAAMLDRRVARFGPVMRAALPGFDAIYARIVAGVDTLDPVPATLLHGDLFPENILVARSPDGGLDVTAVLDFGFLHGAGDPRLDAATAAAIFDMYGPDAETTTVRLTRRFAEALDYPVDVLTLYQAVYAVATANAFAADGHDGHFGWCMAVLGRFGEHTNQP